MKPNPFTIKALIERTPGVTQAQCAEAAGADQGNFSAFLAGRRPGKFEWIGPVAELLGVNPMALVGPEDPRRALAELASALTGTAA